jgi:hypothetical protein
VMAVNKLWLEECFRVLPDMASTFFLVTDISNF